MSTSTISKTFLILFTSVIFLSCNKSFLDAPPKNIVPREAYVKDLTTCNEILNGLYLKLSAGFDMYNAVYPELAADNVKPVTGNPSLVNLYTWNQSAGIETSTTLSPGARNLNGYSYQFYQLISISNFIIEKSKAFRNENPAMADDMAGQALTIKSLSHFLLVNAFAQPYNFTSGGSHPGIVLQNSVDWSKPVLGRNTVSEVYAQLISDLTAAADLLQPQTSSTLRISRNTALSLLSRVLLYKEDYTNSIHYARQVTDKVPLMQITAGYPNDLYKTVKTAQTEVFLHLVPYFSESLGYSNGGVFMGFLFRTNPVFVATNEVAEVLTQEANDIRSKWVIKSGDDWNIVKFPAGLLPDVLPQELSYYHQVIRASDVYLDIAESYANINREDSARYFLDRIRQRANPLAAITNASGAALLDSIRKERRKELCFDGMRLYDMLRWKKAISRTDPNFPTAQNLPYPSSKAIAPIPALDIELSGLKQNPGY